MCVTGWPLFTDFLLPWLFPWLFLVLREISLTSWYGILVKTDTQIESKEWQNFYVQRTCLNSVTFLFSSQIPWLFSPFSLSLTFLWFPGQRSLCVTVWISIRVGYLLHDGKICIKGRCLLGHGPKGYGVSSRATTSWLHKALFAHPICF